MTSTLTIRTISAARTTPGWPTAQSKTANVLFAVGATRRWAGDGITANALHPGGIWTNLTRYLPDDLRESLRTDPDAEYKTPEQGAATSLFDSRLPDALESSSSGWS